MDYFERLQDHIVGKEEIMKRFCDQEEFWIKYIRRFKYDDKTFGMIKQAVKANDIEKMCDYSHMLKGVAATLGFCRMEKLNAEILAAARNERRVDIRTFKMLEEEYEAVINKIY